MSCNGCRILRKGCSDDCLLRQCLQWIDNPQAQANATLFVAKFFGRSGLMSFISSVPKNQRPALFQSLLFEAVGRTVNPVSGAVGLLWTGNWHVCQTVAMTVLRGGAIQALPEFGGGVIGPELDNISECASFRPRNESSSGLKRKRSECGPSNLDFCLMFPAEEKPRREGTPSEESGTSTLGSDICSLQAGGERKLLTLFI